MEKQYIEFSVVHQNISRTDSFDVVANSRNYLHARFTMSGEWEGVAILAAFMLPNGKTYTQEVLGGECVVPWEVLGGSEFYVGLLGGDLITTTAAGVSVKQSIRTKGQESLEPSPSAFEQLVARMEALVERMPVIGENGNWLIWDSELGEYIDSGVSASGSGQPGPAGAGVIPGGYLGQALVKASDKDFDTRWEFIKGGGSADLTEVEGRLDNLETETGGLESRLSDTEGNVSSIIRETTRLESRVVDAEKNVSTVLQTSKGVEVRVTNAENDIATMKMGSQVIEQRVENAEGEISILHQTATGLLSRVSDAEGNLSMLEQTVDEISSIVKDDDGDYSSVIQRVDSLETKVGNAEGDISTLNQSVDTVSIQVNNNRNDIANLVVRAGNVESRVTSAEGDISTLSQRADALESIVGNGDGDTSSLVQRVDSIEAKVEDQDGNIAALTQRADGIESDVVSVEGDISTLNQRADSISALVTDMDGSVTSLRQTVNDISLVVSDPINGGTNRYVTMTLTVGNNTHTGVVMIDGNVDVSGQLSAEALYATLGDIARLKVDSLSTSRRIPMYLARDKSDDNYIDIQEQHITLRRAWTDGSTEQARDDFGAELYWERDIDDADIGTDGYPYVDGARVFITTEVTDWPVMVYSYSSGDRLKIFFDEYNNFGPRMIWGEGASDGTEKGRGFIEKLGLSFDVYNHGTDGVKRGIFMSNTFTDIVGERRLSKATASGNTLTLAFEGGVTKKLTFGTNASGNYTSVTCDGFTTTLEGF